MDANNFYAAAATENDQLMAELAAALQSVAVTGGDKIHWGHVGNLQHVNIKLAECVQFLKSIKVASGLAKVSND
jgi:hypothetical protein